MYEDTPDEQIHDLFAEKILHGHPLGRPTIGTAEIIKKVSRDDVMNYLKKWYSPKNVIVSLAGAIPNDVGERLDRYFHDWRSEGIVQQLKPAEIKGSLSLKPKKTEQVHLCLGVKGPSQLDEDRYAFSVLDNILGGSMSSRLFQEVREKRGLVYSIFSTASPFRNFGVWYVYAGTGSKNLEQVVALVLEQLTQFKKEGITKEEIERAKEYLKGTLVLGLESTSSRMSWMAKSEFYYNRIHTIDEVFGKIDKVSQGDIIRLANQYFRDEYLTLAVIGDLEKLPLSELHC
jgi:predicted Zn-dependent peptidase